MYVIYIKFGSSHYFNLKKINSYTLATYNIQLSKILHKEVESKEMFCSLHIYLDFDNIYLPILESLH